ncbi:hypothetical protein PAAL109150_22950 [Paenibacillus alkaliterrae]
MRKFTCEKGLSLQVIDLKGQPIIMLKVLSKTDVMRLSTLGFQVIELRGNRPYLY